MLMLYYIISFLVYLCQGHFRRFPRTPLTRVTPLTIVSVVEGLDLCMSIWLHSHTLKHSLLNTVAS